MTRVLVLEIEDVPRVVFARGEGETMYEYVESGYRPWDGPPRGPGSWHRTW